MLNDGYGYGCGFGAEVPFSAGAPLANFLRKTPHTDITTPHMPGMPLPPMPTVPGVHPGLLQGGVSYHCVPFQSSPSHFPPPFIPGIPPYRR